MEENQSPKFVDSAEELSINQVPDQEQQFDASTAPEEPTQTQGPTDEYSFTASSNESSLNNDSSELVV